MRGRCEPATMPAHLAALVIPEQAHEDTSSSRLDVVTGAGPERVPGYRRLPRGRQFRRQRQDVRVRSEPGPRKSWSMRVVRLLRMEIP